MNKNLLIKQNNELFSKIQLLKKQNSALLSQLEQQNAATAACLKQIEQLRAELDGIKAGIQGVDAPSAEEAPLEVAPPANAEKPESEEFILPEEFNIASDVIGNIVIKAAGYINELTASDNPNKKELVNLIAIESLLDGDKSLATEELSGYSLKEFIDYEIDLFMIVNYLR
jgi:hypothetical protein